MFTYYLTASTKNSFMFLIFKILEILCRNMKKCRLCVREMEELLNVFDIDNLIEEIYRITTISIERSDTLTTHICTFCNYKITEIQEFQNKCIQAQEILRNEEESISIKLIEMLEEDSFSETDGKYNNNFDGKAEIPPDNLMKLKNEEITSINKTTNYNSDANTADYEGKSEIKNADSIEIEISNNDINSIDETYDDSKLLGPYCTNQNKEQINDEEAQTKKSSKEGRLRYKALLRSCEKCGKLVEKNRLQAHQNQHLGIKPYSCNFENCGKSFYCPYVLTNHKRTHTELNKHECDICGKKYNLQKSLYNHKQKHKTPSYCCKLCDKRYKNSTYLKQHMRTHTGERPYNCKQCDKAFASAYNLKAHLRSHTKEKPFQCQYCGAAYGYNNLLKAHMLSCHSDIKEQ